MIILFIVPVPPSTSPLSFLALHAATRQQRSQFSIWLDSASKLSPSKTLSAEENAPEAHVRSTRLLYVRFSGRLAFISQGPSGSLQSTYSPRRSTFKPKETLRTSVKYSFSSFPTLSLASEFFAFSSQPFG